MNTFENHPGERGDVPGWPVIGLGKRLRCASVDGPESIGSGGSQGAI